MCPHDHQCRSRLVRIDYSDPLGCFQPVQIVHNDYGRPDLVNVDYNRRFESVQLYHNPGKSRFLPVQIDHSGPLGHFQLVRIVHDYHHGGLRFANAQIVDSIGAHRIDPQPTVLALEDHKVS